MNYFEPIDTSPTPYLTILYPRELFRKIPLQERAVIGRGQEADIHFDDELISRRHCEIHYDGTQLYLRDLGSTNGTFMDGKEIQSCTFNPKNRIQAGRMIFKVDFSSSSEDSSELVSFEEATTDKLTGTLNSLAFFDLAVGEIAFAKRNKSEVHLLLLEPDHFESIYKSKGNLAGENILKEIARVLQLEKQDHDLLARFENEIFILLFSGISPDHAFQRAEHLRAAIEKALFSWEDQLIPVTVSAGLISLQGEKFDSFEKTIDDAGKLLYIAKNSDTNRVCHQIQ